MSTGEINSDDYFYKLNEDFEFVEEIKHGRWDIKETAATIFRVIAIAVHADPVCVGIIVRKSLSDIDGVTCKTKFRNMR